ncbi:MAG: phospholipase [Parvibaculum sp.]|nr:phospholipase [Parvibaculum sp.]
MTDNQDDVLDAIMAVVPQLLEALEGLHFIARHLHPPRLEELLQKFGEGDLPVRLGLEAFNAIDWPDDLKPFAAQVNLVATEVLTAYEELRGAETEANPIVGAYRALRHVSRAAEALYPISAMLPPVSPFFLEPQARGDKALAARLAAADMGREDAGLRHLSNDKQERGGFSIYVPETYDAAVPCPLIIAMHGGSGHGRDMLWTWIASARTRGAILLSPTSIGPTWSLMEPELDHQNLMRMIEYVKENWSVDGEHILLTGMSDGGTFTYVLGLQSGAPFTHLAPIAASFHPFLIEMADPARVKDLPVYITHGALDWMFDKEMGRVANRAMTGAGARVVYREIADLSHTYPRDENPHIMDWFLGERK